MKKALSYIVMFTVGAVIGSAVTNRLLKTKYEQIAQEEIDSVKETLSRKFENKKKEVEDMKEYLDITSLYKNDKKEPVVKEVEKMGGPYVIDPEEFDENGYETTSLTYYSDGVLADSITDDIFENQEDLVGDFKDHFGENDNDDAVYVRNDDEEMDYEILLDDRRYSDVVGVSSKYSAEQDYE